MRSDPGMMGDERHHREVLSDGKKPSVLDLAFPTLGEVPSSRSSFLRGLPAPHDPPNNTMTREMCPYNYNTGRMRTLHIQDDPKVLRDEVVTFKTTYGVPSDVTSRLRSTTRTPYTTHTWRRRAPCVPGVHSPPWRALLASLLLVILVTLHHAPQVAGYQCGPCRHAQCGPPLVCPGGVVQADPCRCCLTCARQVGAPCGGGRGVCDAGLTCTVTPDHGQDPQDPGLSGVCTGRCGHLGSQGWKAVGAGLNPVSPRKKSVKNNK